MIIHTFKIENLNLQKIICYHGGIMQKDIDNKLDTLISRYLLKIKLNAL
jgi:hypothetical protein